MPIPKRSNRSRSSSQSTNSKQRVGPRADRRPARQDDQTTNRRIQAIAGIVILAVIGVIIGIVITSNQPQPASASQPALVGTKKYASAPPMMIDKNKSYKATVRLAKGGEFVIQLYADKAPITVNSFVFLARQGFYNGVTFHRVLEGFMAQGGDPTGTGAGGPGYQFVNEDSDLVFDKAGVVAMANAGRNTNGSQFFITFAPQPSLNGGYTIFGQVISGMDVVNGLRRRNPEQNPTFPGDAIESITISE